jgi:hypothetical protein
MRSIEFAAEVAILLIEGPQDKKQAVDLYYGKYREVFPYAREVESRLSRYLRWIKRALPDLSQSRYRRPVDLYSLIAALDLLAARGKVTGTVESRTAGHSLRQFEEKMKSKDLSGDTARYLVAASRQTDNLVPRLTRMQILANLINP